MAEKRISGSFRDPSGFLFRRDGVLYRQVNAAYRPHYDKLIIGGLYEALNGGGLLIPHRVSQAAPLVAENAYVVIEPQEVPFISYPYEWCFSQLKNAALATLNIQKLAMEHGMSLKDASAYNIQIVQGKPVLIDTLSFEIYTPGKPWTAYRQFCRHFLAPLSLMAYVEPRISLMLRDFIDGIPIELASAILPWRTRMKLGLGIHIHLHARSSAKYDRKKITPVKGQFNRNAMLGLIDQLEGMVKSLCWRPAGTEWADYYNDTNYDSDATRHKTTVIENYLNQLNPATVWDLGANDGRYSRLAVKKGCFTCAFDVDPAAVEQNYRQMVKAREINMLPLVMDLTNPSPGLGWKTTERQSLFDRGPADVVMALALVHHLAIGNNVPLPSIAEFLYLTGKNAIVEFVPKDDDQVSRLLVVREDVFPDYTQAHFEFAMANWFSIINKTAIEGSRRVMYLLKRKETV